MFRPFVILSFRIIILSTVVTDNSTDVLTISTEGCTIPGFPLISESISKLVGLPQITPTCSAVVPLLNSNSSHIWIIREAFEYFQVWGEIEFYCCYRNFSADTNLGNIYYGICTQFSSIIEAEHEFVRIECYYNENKIYDDYFVFFAKNNMRPVTYADVRSPNVLLLGIESMSRMNFLRTMPNTSRYLRDKGSIQLLGYNKLGDNSFPNLFPLLTGKWFLDVKENCRRNNIFDTERCPFLWDRFKRAGYNTALGSDSTAGLLGSLEFSLPTIPTDFYLHPFMYETRNVFKHKDYDYHICLHNKLLYKILLNYIQDVSIRAQQHKLFGIFWEETVTHEHLNYPHMMDQDYVDILNKLEDHQYLENTVVILFSDHGMRFGKVVQTEQGRLESRLPVLEFLFPAEFRRRYKLALKNFNENRLRLTTPFDVHETILDLLEPSLLENRQIRWRSRALNRNSNKISLFLPIPENRTCASIGISEHWCTCRQGQKVAVGHKMRMLAAEYLVSHINKILSRYPQCHELNIEQVLDASVVKTKDERGQTYTVMVKTKPGGGIFDGTLVRDQGQWAVSGSVSRLNLYRGQGDCILDSFIRMYCYC